MYKISMIILMFLNMIYFMQANLFAFENKSAKNKDPEQIEKTLRDPPIQSLININNITSFVSCEGYHDWLVGGSWNGSFPINYSIGTIYSEGIVWGGKVNDGSGPEVRVNGNTYGTGCAPLVRIFRIRTDYQTADLTMDASTFFNITPGEVTQNEINLIYLQYQTDWNEWPANEGALYNDIDNNGYYDPSIDIPGVPSASQTIFIKYNDSIEPGLYQSPPIGLEISETYWAFPDAPALTNTIFKKVDMVYTGGNLPYPGSYIDSMYVCQWSDPDVGNSTDDFAGCDSVLNLGYSYNANPVDDDYQTIGFEPPATGYAMLQGVSQYTGNPIDSAIINFKWRHGYKYFNRKPMSSYVYFAAGGTWNDPAFTYTGTLEFYNLMRGFKPDPPYPEAVPFPEIVADYTGTGCYLLPGDPVSGTGKRDGTVDSPGDRRMVVINGPFFMNLNDTVESVIALTTAVGINYLESVTELRKNAFSADSAFQSYVEFTSVSASEIRISNNFGYTLLQNYPNPFNPTTSIKYSITSEQLVTIKVYDLLGREIETLVNEEKPKGTYKSTWNAVNLPSGVYFYQLRAGNFVETKKMILLR